MLVKEDKESKKSKPLGIAIGAVLIVCSILLLAYEMNLFGGVGGKGDMFVSADDGKSFQTASFKQFPPYTSGGNEYVRAIVFNDGSKNFVGYLFKYGDATRQRLLAAQDKLGAAVVNCNSTGRLDETDVFVKKPGSGGWVPLTDPSAMDIQIIKDASGKRLQPVVP